MHIRDLPQMAFVCELLHVFDKLDIKRSNKDDGANKTQDNIPAMLNIY